MATKQKRKCMYCHHQIEIYEPEVMYYNGHYYHLDCFKVLKDQIPNSEKMISDKSDLWNFLLQLKENNILDDDYLKGKLNLDLMFLFNANCTYGGIFQTLIYVLYVKKRPIDSNKGLLPLIYFYDEAKRYYTQKEVYNKKIQNITLNIDEQTVYIKPKTSYDKHLIDITKI